MDINAPEFGERIAGVSYQVRPGAYAIILKPEGQVAVVKATAGVFLPGGGIEGGESAEAALVREVREECGWDVVILDKIGEAVQYVHAAGEGYFAKHCIFYRCNIARESAGKVEFDHETLWLPVAEAQERLTHQSQSSAVAEAAGR